MEGDISNLDTRRTTDEEEFQLPPFGGSPMSGISDENLLQLSCGKTFFRLSGPEDSKYPLVVCMHGLGMWSIVYAFLEPALVKNGFRVLVFGNPFDCTPHFWQIGMEEVRQMLHLSTILPNCW
jgi:hypothetical protein